MATKKERQNYHPTNRLLTICLIAIVLILSSCNGGAATPTTTTITPPVTTTPPPTTTPPTACQPVTPLFSVAEVILDQDHPCREWVYKLQGRVTKNSGQSASVWSLRTEAGTAIIVSALHTLGEGYLGPGGSLIEEQLRDPDEKPGATRIFLVKGEDGSVDSLASVLFILYNPEVPPGQSGNHLRDILPRHDFFVVPTSFTRYRGPPCTIPLFAPLAPAAKSFFSIRQVLRPRIAQSRAIPVPFTPPPITITSKCCVMIF